MKLAYTTIGTNNMSKAVQFYDALFDSVTINKVIPDGRIVVYKGEGFLFAIAEPFDELNSTPGNGSMLGFLMNSVEDITKFYNLALSLGGTCEGLPGPRSKGPAAYVRDLDGNKLCFFCFDDPALFTL
jgi:catechol 2,3-dioxygenase-like lactoylglutathione lyase family enzyme